MSETKAFFAQALAYLKSEEFPENSLTKLGDNASAPARLAWYPALIARQQESAIESLFSACCAAARQLAPGLWRELITAYRHAYQPNSARPTDYARGFVPWLESWCEQDPSRTTLLLELADYEWLCFDLTAQPVDAIGEDRAWHIRMYEYPVTRIVAALAESQTIDHLLTKEAETLVIFQDASTARARVLWPTPFMLIALAVRAGQALPVGIDAARVAEAETQLRSRGVR
ncbi:MAG: hypothetical protein Q8Q09_04390 [Deltaproteobacteria bacterium]|nr:hypothetical protein [Deltaproteobacteria bacterium]